MAVTMLIYLLHFFCVGASENFGSACKNVNFWLKRASKMY